MNIYVCGIDAGSNTVKVVILNSDEMVSYRVMKTGHNSVQTAKNALQSTLDAVGISAHDLQYTVSTGYGRNYIHNANQSITEISCHARGVHHLLPDVRTIIDIGGQDSKAIYLDPSGNVDDFVMNDKCAAGTGRFLEVIAAALNIELEDMGDESFKASNEVEISNTCTVFAESEVITHVARGADLPAIVAGIHRSIVRRILAMVRRKTVLPKVAVTGGVAKNKGVVRLIQEEMQQDIVIPQEPQITGALGAALWAREKVRN
jgi:predicted CoA-substrate-specific enzyme activase